MHRLACDAQLVHRKSKLLRHMHPALADAAPADAAQVSLVDHPAQRRRDTKLSENHSHVLRLCGTIQAG